MDSPRQGQEKSGSVVRKLEAKLESGNTVNNPGTGSRIRYFSHKLVIAYKSESRCRGRNRPELEKRKRKNTTKAVLVNTCCLKRN